MHDLPMLTTCPLPPVTREKCTVVVSYIVRGGVCVCVCRTGQGLLSLKECVRKGGGGERERGGRGGLSQQGKKQVHRSLLDSLMAEVPQGHGTTPVLYFAMVILLTKSICVLFCVAASPAGRGARTLRATPTPISSPAHRRWPAAARCSSTRPACTGRLFACK